MAVSKKIVFTLCSNNYLAQAKTLGDSVLLHNPDYHFIIGLVDRKDTAIDYNFFEGFEIIEVEKLSITYLDELSKKYNIVELNTAVKPHYIDYIAKAKSPATIIYLDPDIIVFNNFLSIEEELNGHDMVLSPHFCSPPKDDLSPSDYDMLRTGVYNLGFLALKNNVETLNFCDWWKIKLKERGQADLSLGLFTDQIWMHFAPTFVNAKVSKHLGYNVANWNLHERTINLKDGIFFINNTFRLVFFHFSNYRLNNENSMASYNNRFTLLDRPDAKLLFDLFRERLIENRHDIFINITPYFTQVRNQYLNELASGQNNDSPRVYTALKKRVKRIFKLG
jgi:hypothetical protein